MRADILLHKINNNIDTILNEDKYKRFLNIVGRFHNYSVLNQLLITLQMPEASKIAGHKAWSELGRRVINGSRGIPILANKYSNVYIDIKSGNRLKKNQMTRTEINRAIELGLIRKERVESGLIGVYVFDISQTELIDKSENMDTEIEDLREEYKDLDNLTKVIKDITEINTEFDGKIVDVQLTNALIRAASNELVNRIDKDINGKDGEVIVDSVAYSVMTYLGMDTSFYKFGYISNMYIEDKEKLKNDLSNINILVRTFIDAIDKNYGNLQKYSSELDERIIKEELADDILTMLEAKLLRHKVYS